MTIDSQAQINELKTIIFDMEDDVLAILDYVGLLQQSSIQDGSLGASRVCDIVKEHGTALKAARNRSHELIQKLSSP